MKTHLVVGGCGFLGRHLARALAVRGDSVRVVDVVTEGAPVLLGVETRVLDVARLDPHGFDDLVASVDVVHHCAWSTIPESANLDPRADLTINLGITLGLLDSLKRRGRGRIVFCSSGGTVYGPLRSTPVSEDHPLDPITAYGVSKLAAEKYLQLYRRLHGIDARVARIANPYGAGQNPRRPQGLIGTVVHRALARQTIEIWGDGTLIRDFIHISDVAAGLVRLADADDLPSDTMPIFNFGSGSGSSVNEIVAHVGATDVPPLDVRRGPGRAFDVPASVLDIRKAGEQLEWRPQIALQHGIVQMVADLKADPDRAFSSW